MFSLPSASHFGGGWEATIKSTKFRLGRVLGNAIACEEVTAVAVQIEVVLNSGPLCFLSDNVTDCFVLAPGSFLIEEALVVLPELDLSTEPMTGLTRWRCLNGR